MPRPSPDSVDAALDSFRGTFDQLPPSYSAVHVNGRRAHEIAREGSTPEVRPRSVTVYELRVVDVRLASGLVGEIDVEIECSAGTYIRSIARDLGRRVNSAAHVVALRRSAIGPFGLDRSRPADRLVLPNDLHDLASVLVELPGVVRIDLDDSQARLVHNGQPLPASRLVLPDDLCPDAKMVLVHDDRSVAVGSIAAGRLVYDLVIPHGSAR